MKFRGVKPSLVATQVRNTAAWALDGPVDGAAHSWRRALASAAEIPHGHDGEGAYLRLLLAAHHATVATFVPTDVDSHIRFHAWQRCETVDDLRVAAAVVEETAAWDPAEVSARVVTVDGVGAISGHDGEWMGVRAGALGRALALDDAATIDAQTAFLDVAIDRHAEAFAAVQRAKGRELVALAVVATIAHNLGDLSRVVETWPVKSPSALALRRRYAKLGHETDGDPRFALAGRLYKRVMAAENPRFLALRAARPLRVHRDLLVGIGPFFDAWGEVIARHPSLADRAPGGDLGGRGAVLAALVTSHLAAPTAQGFLRAIAGFHRAAPGGVERYADEVAARERASLRTGAIREALGVDRERFEARMVNKYRAALDAG
jgi:hypothetical protein